MKLNKNGELIKQKCELIKQKERINIITQTPFGIIFQIKFI